MQDEYFGDVNDYRKYGLLRCLDEVELCVGVCWMYTPSDNSGQGQRTSYLDKADKYRFRDPELFDFLKERVHAQRRAVREFEEVSDTLLPRATFFSESLPEVAGERDTYFGRALVALDKADVLFFDPNIGLETPSVRYGRTGSSNYLYWWEAERAAHEQASIVIFQHWTQNEKRDDLLARLSSGLRYRMPRTSVYTIRSPHVLFLAACQPSHRDRFTKAVRLARRRWNGDMEIVDPADSQAFEPAISRRART